MNPLLEQFLSESRDFLQSIGEKLMQLEDAPTDPELINELFRMVHTLKGNSGLFEFPEMTRVLHAGEDLMVVIRTGRADYSQVAADRLLDVMDFVGMLCDEIEANGVLGATHAGQSGSLAEALRYLIPAPAQEPSKDSVTTGLAPTAATQVASVDWVPLALDAIPEAARMEVFRQAGATGIHFLAFTPEEGCYYQGSDPFQQVRRTPGILWGAIRLREAWPKLADLDAYRNVLDFHLLTIATREELDEDFRYVVDQVQFSSLTHFALVRPQGDLNGGPVYEDFVADALGYLDEGNILALQRAAEALLKLSNPDLWLSSALRWLLLIIEKEPAAFTALRAMVESLTTLQAPDWSALALQGPIPAGSVSQADVPKASGEPRYHQAHLSNHVSIETVKGVLLIQRSILAISDNSLWQRGRIQAASTTVSACLKSIGDQEGLAGWHAEVASALESDNGKGLVAWLDQRCGIAGSSIEVTPPKPSASQPLPIGRMPEPGASQADPRAESEVKYGRRAEDSQGQSKSLKVDQVKIDRLMNLIGEMVVSKNALPYLAARAENVFGVRELAREIKAQYAVINRISDEMQDAIMQVRMMPASFVFQRFPRLVRDTSRKLGKEVNLVLVGEETEADKNIIEALGDPLVHIVRNSLDHGFELPDVRLAAGKPVAGTLTITATQESDRVVIEIKDDGKGIDPVAIKQKAYEKGIINEETLDRISDHDAINLIFAPGLSTAEVVSDLSGRGVGMDVVRTVIEKLNGTIHLESERGKGTCLHLSLPLSMAVTNVVIVEADGQTFGLPMDSVVETVRIPRSGIWSIKNTQATVLRGRTMALKSLNELLGIPAAPKTNADGESAVIVVRMGGEQVGLLVDSFHETVDVILKPMTGILNGLSAYAGSALMGDGSVLIILNVKELL